MPLHVVALLLPLTDGGQRVMLGDHPAIHHGGCKVEEGDHHEEQDHDQIGEDFPEVSGCFHYLLFSVYHFSHKFTFLFPEKDADEVRFWRQHKKEWEKYVFSHSIILSVYLLKTPADGEAHTGIGTVVHEVAAPAEVELTHPVVAGQVLPPYSQSQAGTGSCL